MKKVVVIGGGTGSFTVLSGLKKYPLEISSIVTMADSGGSTGRLRDEFGYLPPGDFRMAMVALAPEDSSQMLRDLFLYRFDKGEKGLKGHNFGNLFLVALSDLLGSYEKGISYMSKLLGIKGKIFPVTRELVNLVCEYEDGKVVEGESKIDDPPKKHNGKQKIEKIWIEPEVSMNPEAQYVILEADLIIIGPGDLYTSTLANLVVPGVSKALQKSEAKILYVMNLVTKYGQTYGFGAADHLNELKKYIKKYPDYVLVNNTSLPERVLKDYAKENDFEVKDDLEDLVTKDFDINVIRADLLAPRVVKKPSGDVVKRSLVRHDPDKIAWEVFKLLKENHQASI